MHFSVRAFMCLVFLGLCLTVPLTLTSHIQAEDANQLSAYGKVVDKEGYPIPDAHVIFWNIERSFSTKTNASGCYEIDIEGWKSYQVYAYYDNSSTPGFDYFPACNRTVSIKNSSINVSFTLSPGASINAEGDLRSFETFEPPTMVVFTVVDQQGLLKEANSVTEYGEGVLESYLMGLGDRAIVVPSDIPVKVNVTIFFPSGLVQRCTIDNESDYFSLAQGELLNIDVRKYKIKADVDSCYGYVASARATVNEAEGAGFYVSYERNELSRAESLVDAANSAISEGDYDLAQANLRQAYLITRSVEDAISSLYVNASKSTLFITPFLGFTAVAIASVLYDDRRRRLVLSLALYFLLFAFLYLLYPGYAALQKGTAQKLFLTALLSVTSFLAAYFAVYMLPYVSKEKTTKEGISRLSAVVTAFSMSGRNLRRRKLRTLLMLAILFTSVFAFTTLTSFSYEHGFFVEPRLIPAGPIEGFLVRKPGETSPFEPLQSQIPDWLKDRSEVVIVVPKFENLPQMMYLEYIEAKSVGVQGVLGVFPSLEAKVTKMDTIIVEGRFLSDNDTNGILISRVMANSLQVKVNDTLQLFDRNFTLTGIFDDNDFDGLKDLDGEQVAPWKIVPFMMTYAHCSSFETVIMHQETARKFPFVAMSRVDVQTLSSDDIIPTARLAVLRWEGTQAFATVGGRVQQLSVGSYYIASGFASAMIPLGLVVLNIATFMISTVYERRREIAIMSSVGLNPFHISAVFVAESVVIGVVAGSLGYLFGLISYRFMTFLPVSLVLKQKVEVGWSILTVCLSIAAAVIGSALPATKASIIVTPSLLRRWKIKIEEKPRVAGEAWVIKMPIQIKEENLEKFFGFMKNVLQTYTHYHMFDTVDNLETIRKEEVGPTAIRLSFTYSCSEEGIVTNNDLFSEKSSVASWYDIKLASKTPQGTLTGRDEASVRRTASFIRRLVLQYSHKHKA